MENNPNHNPYAESNNGLIQQFLLHYYSIKILLLVSIIILFFVLRNTSKYCFKITGVYLTVFFTATLSALICIPLYFIGDSSKFVFDFLYYCSLWTGIKCDVRRKEVLQMDPPFIMLMNHQSSIDTIVLSNFWPKNCTIMMKRSLCFIPFFGFTAILCHSIFVDRYNHKNAVQCLARCADTIKTKNLSLAVFPEGTRNHGDGMLPFKKGAFNVAVQAKIPIIPCVISSYKNFYNKEKRYFSESGRVIVEMMDPVPTDKFTLDDVPELAEKVRDEMMKVYDRINKEIEGNQNETFASKKDE